jgi:hypothetical protein
MRNPWTFLSALLLLAAPACGDNGGDDDSSTGPATSTPTNEPTTEPTTEPTGGGEALSCTNYCTTITANCKMDTADAQYFIGADNGMTACMDLCEGFPVGVKGETSGNTLGCRTYHAEAAEGDPATHCPHAGPGGAAMCGMNCEGFCSAAVEVCGATYADETACMTECSGFMDTVRYDVSQAAGNTLACRLYHLTAAGVDPATHCPHITAASGPCV